METEEIAEEAEKLEQEREQRDQERRDKIITKELWKVYSNKVLRFFAVVGIISFIMVSVGLAPVYQGNALLIALIPFVASILTGSIMSGKLRK